MFYAFGGSCFGEQYIRLAQHYVLQTIGLDLIVESAGTQCLQLIVCLEIVKPYAAGYFCQPTQKN